MKLIDARDNGKIVWRENEVATQAPVTDDPGQFFGHLEVMVAELANDSNIDELDEHSRFLIGDWPR